MKPAWSLRTSTPRDEDAVTALLEATYPPLMQGYYEADILAEALPDMTKANPKLLASGSFYLAETDTGQAVGCGGWTRDRPGTGDVESGLAHIRHFAVHPGFGGQGIARALFERCKVDARAEGLARLECNSSLNAEGFYAAMGLERLKRIEVALGNGVMLPSILMTGKL